MLWNKSLETGISSIDQQHQELFRRAELLMDKSNENRIAETLVFLETYINTHFRDEEALHRKFNYPKAAEHKGYHEAYKKSFHELKLRFAQEGQNLLTTLAIYDSVTLWLKDHILVQDMDFGRYFKTLGK